MKYLIVSFLIAFSMNAVAAGGKISLKCEEGVGNRSNPVQFVMIEGVIASPEKKGELSDAEKKLLKVSIDDGQDIVVLNNSEYKISLHESEPQYSQNADLTIVLLTEKSRFTAFQVFEAGGPELIVHAYGPSFFTGRQKVVDSGLCWGGSPFPRDTF